MISITVKTKAAKYYPRYFHGSSTELKLQIQGVGFDPADKDKVYHVAASTQFMDMADPCFYSLELIDSPLTQELGRVHVGSNSKSATYSKVSALDARLHLVIPTKQQGYLDLNQHITNEEYLRVGVGPDDLVIKERLTGDQWNALSAGKSML